MNKVVNTLKKISKIKFRFILPVSKKILLFDEIHSAILREITNKDFNILKVREEKEIFIWIFLKQIIALDFKFSTYCKNYIKYTAPKVIITFIDTNIQFYELKNSFKEIKFISIQNGHRLENYSMFHNKKYRSFKKLKCDHIFVFNKYYVKEYKKIIDSNYHILGNFKNNLVKIDKSKNNNNFLFISQYVRNHKKKNFQIKLLNFINIYLSNLGKKIHILLRNKNNLKQNEEIEFYKKIFKSNCIFKKTSNWKESYKILDEYENIIFMFSTFGYEAISRKKKVAIFSPSINSDHKLNFGWPAPFQKKYNFFSARELNLKETNRVLNNIYKCSQTSWISKYYNIIKDQLYFDKNNSKLRELIIKLINN